MSAPLRPRARRLLAAALLGLSLPGCRDQEALTAPSRPAALQGVVRGLLPTVLACPTDVEERAAAWIGPDGGSVAAPSARLTVPAGAVDAPTRFEIVVPAVRTMKVDIHAAGVEHFRFRSPATITLDFSRCAGAALPASLLGGAYINMQSEAVLEFMGGTVDLSGRRVTFTTPHLSGYAIVY